VTGADRLLERTDDLALRGYLGFVSRQQPLTNTEESALARRIRDGDNEAIDKLVNANLSFVVRFAMRFRNRGLDDLDLIAEGTVGLIKALRRGGWGGECRLVAVAAWWIQDAIHEAIGEQVGPRAVLLLPGTPQEP